jgi:hypothetical protein
VDAKGNYFLAEDEVQTQPVSKKTINKHYKPSK